MSSVSETPKFKIENVALWFKCRECKRCFHSLLVLEEHFFEQHPEKDFIFPKNLPPGAMDGRIYLKTSSQKEQKLIRRDFASLLEQPAAEVHTKRQHQHADLETANPLEEISSTANGKGNYGKLASTDTQVVGKRRRILAARGNAVAITASKILKLKVKMVRRNGNSSSNAASNDVGRNNGGRKYRCAECPFRTMSVKHLERHSKLHQKGSKAVICGRCHWFVHPSGLGFHIFMSHVKRQRSKLTDF